jgi:uncharacterized protein YraI
MRNPLDALRKRHLRATVAVTGAVVALLVAMPGAASAAGSASGRVNTAGSPLNVRSGPSSSWDAWRTVADGASVTILCQQAGSTESGTYGTSNIWDMLANGGMVSDTYIFTGSDGRVTDDCNYVGAPPHSNPRGTNAAVNWAFNHHGSTAYEGLCLHFVALAYGYSHAGWGTAEAGGDYITSHGLMHSGVPPRGALVWYHNSSGDGHVALSLGEGKVISTSVSGHVAVADYTFHSQLRGWSVAELPLAS